jgi:hypothetical protein
MPLTVVQQLEKAQASLFFYGFEVRYSGSSKNSEVALLGFRDEPVATAYLLAQWTQRRRHINSMQKVERAVHVPHFARSAIE